MTCELALEKLLDAEPSEFSANERTPLGEHLRGCAPCRRVAAQLMHDTQQLAVAFGAATVRRPEPRTRRVSFAPAFAVAALAFAVVLRVRPAAPPPILEPTRSEPSVPLAVASQSAAPNVTPVAAHTPGIRSASGRAFARAVPIAPVRLEPTDLPVSQTSVETSDVTVTPPPGMRATVMHTSNPKLVVVWLH
jgi:hypothetical protein